MPEPKYAGNPTGEGNPPGKHSEGYLKNPGNGGHFVSDKSYRGDMHVGEIKETPPFVGNQPQQNDKKTLESFAKKENSI